MDLELLQILCCPETRQRLRPAEAALIESLNSQIARGALQNHAGQPVRERIDAGLVREDGAWLYPIRQSIPILLIDEALPLRALSR